jgi:hypothetical protein
MVECHASIHSFSDIRRYVTETLSQQEMLRPESVRLTLNPLKRGGKPCGVFFCLHGPRSLRLTAVWETDANTILFYGSRGERIQRTRLIGAPSIDSPTVAQCVAA